MIISSPTSLAKIKTALIILLIIIVIGTSGYMIIEGDSFLDAFYMTIITISTVGFGEIHALSAAGRIFTIILIVTSFGMYAYAISIITTHFVEGKLAYFLKGYKIKPLKPMENHIVICGFGRNGQQAANELKAYKEPFVVIDNNTDLIKDLLSKPFRFIEGDATQDEVLIRADIKTAKSIITTLPNDADNLYVVITARALNPRLNIISRASDTSSEKKLRMASVDNVIMPEKVGGAHMAKMVARPDLIEFLDRLSISGEAPTNLEEIISSNFTEDLINRTLFEIQIRKKTGVNIVGFKTPQGEYILNPHPDTILTPGSKLFVLGTPEQIERMRNIFNQPPEKKGK